MFGIEFGKKKEEVEQSKVYTETDLKNAETEYLEAEKEFNDVDFSAEDFDEFNSFKKKTRWENASKEYQNIHNALHPEERLGENANKVILPSAESEE